MSAPKVSGGPVASGRRASVIGWVIGICLAVFGAATFFALNQPPRPDPFQPVMLKEKFLFPYEENAFMRLPRVSGTLNGVFVVPMSGHVWAVGDGGLILVSRDGGRSWERSRPPVGPQPSQPSFPSPSSIRISRFDWRTRTAHAADPVKIRNEQKKVPLDIRQQAPVVKAIKKPPEKPEEKQQMPGNTPPVAALDLRSIFFVDDNFGWIAGSNGTILSTMDGGASWQFQVSDTDDSLLSIHFADREQGWACGYNGTILSTSDGGRNWQVQISGTHFNLEAVHFVDSQHGWACGQNGTILSTSNGGASWEAQSSGTMGIWLLSIHFTDRMRGWACGIGGTILSTSDGGASWQAQSGGTNATLRSIHFSDSKRGWVCGETGTILSTGDGGRSWQGQKSGTDAWLNSISFTDGEHGWSCGFGGTILTTSDGGKSWQGQTNGLSALLADIYVTDREHGWACGHHGTILSTTDGGRSWKTQASGTAARLNSIFFIDNEHGWACGYNGTILSTSDGGRNWQVQTSGTHFNLEAVHFVDGQRGWACGERSMILLTTDGGVRWQAQSSGMNVWWKSINFTDHDRGWACGENGTILSTRDGGTIWRTQTSGTAARLDSIFFTNDERGWACGENGTILSTRDGGAIWQTQASGTAARLDSIFFTDGERGWACGEKGTILTTSNGGRSWQSQPSVTATWLYSIHFTDRERGWACGDGGTILFTADGGQTWHLPPYRRLPAPWYWSLCLTLIMVCLFVVQRRGQPEAAGETVADLLASDRPLEEGDPDPLDLHRISSGLARFIANRNTDPPLTMAVTGEWGTGKSSLMNLLYHDLKKRRFQPVWFNAWHHQKGEQLLASLYAHIRRQAVPPLWHPSGILFRLRLLFRRGRRNRLAFGVLAFLLFAAYPFLEGVILSLAGGLSALVRALFKGDLAAAWKLFSFADLLSAIPENWIGALLASPAVAAALRGIRAFGLSPQSLLAFDTADGGKKSGLDPGARSRFAQEFQDVAASLDLGAMVIFIDDLDRCSKENVVEILETINFLTVSGRCFIILGMARQWVETCVALQFKELAEETGNEKNKKEDGYAHRRRFAKQYLEKLINIEVPVPVPSPDAARALLTPQTPEPVSPMVRILTAAGNVLKKYSPVVCLAILAVLAWYLRDLFRPTAAPEPTTETEELLVLPADSQQGELVFYEGRIRIPLNQMAAPPGDPKDRPLEIVLKGSPRALEEGLAIGTLGNDDRSAELVLRYAPRATAKAPAAEPEIKKDQMPQTPEEKQSGVTDFRPGAEDTSRTGHWLALLAGLGLAAIGVLYLLQRPQRFTADSKTFRDALGIWHPWIVLVRRTPRTIKRFLNRLRYVAMRLRSEPEHLSLWERLRRRIAGKPEGSMETSEGVPEPVLVALGAIYHVKPGWVKDEDLLRDIFSNTIDRLVGRLETVFGESTEGSDKTIETARQLNDAIVKYQQAFGQDVNSLILHREAFLEVLAETGM